jgi:ABC-type multidrug transport system fused ATPase/permease subunit
VRVSDLTNTINALGGTLDVECGSSAADTCQFKQNTLMQLFGANGLRLNGCTFGECIAQSVIDTGGNSPSSTGEQEDRKKSLSGGVVAGLAVVGGLVGLGLILLGWGCVNQRKARRVGVLGIGKEAEGEEKTKVDVRWEDVSYVIPGQTGLLGGLRNRKGKAQGVDKVILDRVSGEVKAGEMMAVLGPSGRFSLSSQLCQPVTNSDAINRCW